MTDDTQLQNQAEFLYTAASKQLYNFALYAVGDQAAAEQITAKALADAFLCVPDKSSVEQFSLRSIQYLYRYGRKEQIKTVYNIREIMRLQNADWQEKTAKGRLLECLRKSSYDERCILLLFCWMKLSTRQIAAITGRPVFVTRRRLLAAIHKAIKLRECCYHSSLIPPNP